jgi:hypothetical protein
MKKLTEIPNCKIGKIYWSTRTGNVEFEKFSTFPVEKCYTSNGNVTLSTNK